MSENKSILPSAEDIFDSSGLKLWFPSNKQKQLVLKIIKHTVEITKEKALEIAAEEVTFKMSFSESAIPDVVVNKESILKLKSDPRLKP